MIDHGNASDEDFIILKRADHDLPESKELVEHDIEDLSKRKLKLSRTKRMVAKCGQLGHKLIFDDDRNAHGVYEMVDPQEFYKHAIDSVKEAGRKFAEEEKGKLMEEDVVDKELAKEKNESARSARKG